MTRERAMVGLGLVLLLAAAPALARTHRRHAAPAPPPPARTPHSFYPDEVEGGVSGNLPFNNQIRKHTDPLNANGGK